MVTAAVVLMALQSVALGQLLPNRTDLKAAYCLGVSHSILYTLDEMQSMANDLSEEERSTLERASEKKKDVLHRLTSYLQPRVSHLDVAALSMASQRGIKDFKQSEAEMRACIATCLSVEERLCEQQCQDANSEIKTRLSQCNNPTWLPF